MADAPFIVIYRVLTAAAVFAAGGALLFSLFSLLPVIDPRKTIRRTQAALFLLTAAAVLALAQAGYFFILLELFVIADQGFRCILDLVQKAGASLLPAAGATLLIVLFAVYALTVRYVDTAAVVRPLTRFRQKLCFLLFPAVLAGVVYDGALLRAVALRVADASAGPFHLHSCALVAPLRVDGLYWSFIALAALILLVTVLVFAARVSYELAHGLRPRMMIALRGVIVALAGIAGVSLVLGMHNELCPLVLDLEGHHCFFCGMTYALDTLLGSALIIGGGILAVAVALTPAVVPAGGVSPPEEPCAYAFHNAFIMAGLAIGVGTLMMLARVIVSFVRG